MYRNEKRKEFQEDIHVPLAPEVSPPCRDRWKMLGLFLSVSPFRPCIQHIVSPVESDFFVSISLPPQ